MRICLMVEGQEGLDWDQWLALACAAEDANLDGLFRSDHYRSIVRGDPAGSLDASSTLAALAAATQTIRLGTLVSPVTFRHVSILAKSVVTVDHISRGRVELGVGAGWFESEHAAYGFAFPALRERGDELERQLEELNRQWTTAADIWPKPVQNPRPPIIVGGNAGPRTVQAAVRFADEYNTPVPTVQQARERCETLRAAARDAGRDPLRFSMMIGCAVGRDEPEARSRIKNWCATTAGNDPPPLAGTVEEVAEKLREYRTAGVERAMLQHLVHDDVEMVAVLGDLQRALAEDSERP